MKKSPQVVMPDPIRHPVLSWIPAFAGMTNLRYIAAGVILVLSLLVMPAAVLPAQMVSVEILFMNHGPLLSTIKGIKELCNGCGKALTVAWYDSDSPESEKFMDKKGVHQHVPLIIWIAGKPTLKVNGKEIQFVGFPTGSGPPSFQGNWTMNDLRAALDQTTGKK